MELVIPDGAQVHITIGQAPTLALSHDSPALRAKPDYRSGRIAKGLLAGVVLFGAFPSGQRVGRTAGGSCRHLGWRLCGRDPP